MARAAKDSLSFTVLTLIYGNGGRPAAEARPSALPVRTQMHALWASGDTVDFYWTTGLVAGTAPLFHLGATQVYCVIKQLRV